MENNEELEMIRQELSKLDDAEAKKILNGIMEDIEDLSCYEDMLRDFRNAEDAYGPADEQFEKIEVMMFEYMIDESTDALENELSGELLNELGAKYYSGECFDTDYEKAVQYYQKAKAFGDATAIENLGYCYYYGNGCTKSYKDAYENFSLAYSLSHSCICLYKIGDMYKNGYYVEKNENAAFRLYENAYEIACRENRLYSGDAALRLADCYKNGVGTETDQDQALYYYLIAEIRLIEKDDAGLPFTKKMLNHVKDEVNELNEQSKIMILVD